jgi:hypothetical protein
MCHLKLGKVFGMGAVLGFVWGGGFVGYHIFNEIKVEERPKATVLETKRV